MDKELTYKFMESLHGVKYLDDLDFIEMILLSVVASSNLREFLKIAFKLERKRRPLLLEMKGI